VFEGFLSHDHVGINLSQSRSDFTDLLGRNVVSINEESVVVFSGGLLKSSPVGFFLESLFGFLFGWHFNKMNNNPKRDSRKKPTGEDFKRPPENTTTLSSLMLTTFLPSKSVKSDLD
jgi:hypothetical protein